MIRITARRRIKLDNITLGGKKPLIAIPVIGSEEKEFLENVQEAASYAPDLLELRVDYIMPTEELLHRIIKYAARYGIPLLVTNRAWREGGASEQDESHRVKVLMDACSMGINAVDIELSTPISLLSSLMREAKRRKVITVISYHNFENTPREEDIIRVAREEKNAGADVLKIVTMAEDYEDSLRLLKAALLIREIFDGPLIMMAMGEYGTITRIIGPFFATDLIFASLPGKSSAPGQLDVENQRTILQKFGLF